jgi:hypothetical protein
MVKFVEVDPDEMPGFGFSGRGSVSYPILSQFLETGMKVVMMDREGVTQSLQGLTSALTTYIKVHEIPVRVFVRKGQLYLARTDIGEDGKVNPENNNLDKVKAATAAKNGVSYDTDDEDVFDKIEVLSQEKVAEGLAAAGGAPSQ